MSRSSSSSSLSSSSLWCAAKNEWVENVENRSYQIYKLRTLNIPLGYASRYVHFQNSPHFDFSYIVWRYYYKAFAHLLRFAMNNRFSEIPPFTHISSAFCHLNQHEHMFQSTNFTALDSLFLAFFIHSIIHSHALFSDYKTNFFIFFLTGTGHTVD